MKFAYLFFTMRGALGIGNWELGIKGFKKREQGRQGVRKLGDKGTRGQGDKQNS
jgi:hypothetical protein